MHLKSLLLLMLVLVTNSTSTGNVKHTVMSTCLEDDSIANSFEDDSSFLALPTTPVQLSCPPDKRIHIQHAFFGAATVDDSTAGAGNRCRHIRGDCFRMDASLNRVCNGRTDCVTSVRSPAPIAASGTCRQSVKPAYYQVVYDCVSFDELRDVCRSKRLIGQQGHVISPAYPEAYPAGLNCTLTLSLPSSTDTHRVGQRQKIRLTLLSLDLDCNSSLTLIDTGSRGRQPQVWRRCGQRRMESAMMADGPDVRVSLITGPVAGVGYTGFWLYYKAVPLMPEGPATSATTTESTPAAATNSGASPAIVLVGDVTSRSNGGWGGIGRGGEGRGSVFVNYRDGSASTGRFSGYGDSVVIFLVILVTTLLVLLAVVLATFVFRLFKAKEAAARECDDSHEILYSPSTVPLAMAGLPHSLSGTCGFYDNRGEQQQGCSTTSATLPASRSRQQNRFKHQQQPQQQQQLLLLPQPIRGTAVDCCSTARRSAAATTDCGNSNDYQDLGDLVGAAEFRRRSDGAVYSETSNV